MGLFGNKSNDDTPPLTDQEKTDLIKDDHMRRARRNKAADPNDVADQAEYWAQQGHEPPASQR